MAGSTGLGATGGLSASAAEDHVGANCPPESGLQSNSQMHWRTSRQWHPMRWMQTKPLKLMPMRAHAVRPRGINLNPAAAQAAVQAVAPRSFKPASAGFAHPKQRVETRCLG